MRKEYDFKNAKLNPYIKNYGNKFPLGLSDCAQHSKQKNIMWK